jgi:hypothetical protein
MESYRQFKDLPKAKKVKAMKVFKKVMKMSPKARQKFFDRLEKRNGHKGHGR